MSGQEPMQEERMDTRLKRRGLVVLVVAVLGVVAIFAMKRIGLRHAQQSEETALFAGDFVRIATATPSSPERDLILQGEVLPYAQTTLYAKIAGYLDRISVDKGDRVKSGQVLAVLRAPETDSAYEGLEADARNKAANLGRAKDLYAEKLISLQDFQQADTDARVAQESLASLAAQKGYQVFRAPFDGVVTARFADPGALFQTGNGAQPLVTVAQVRRLRLDVFVDQRAAATVKTGDAVTVSPEGQTGLQIAARVSRTSGTLDPKTRTLLAEIDLDNRDGRLLPGGFASVTLHLKVPPRLEIPAEAIIIRKGITHVAVVDSKDRVHFQAVVLGDEDQQRYPILSGLQAGERVALNLGAGALEGDKVQPVAQ